MKYEDILSLISEKGEVSELELLSEDSTIQAVYQQLYRLRKKQLIIKNENGKYEINPTLKKNYLEYMKSLEKLDKDELLKEISKLAWFKVLPLHKGAIKKAITLMEAIL